MFNRFIACVLFVLAVSPFNAPFQAGPTGIADAESIESVEPLSALRQKYAQALAARPPIDSPEIQPARWSVFALALSHICLFYAFHALRRCRTILSGDYSALLTVVRV